MTRLVDALMIVSRSGAGFLPARTRIRTMRPFAGTIDVVLLGVR